MKIAQIAVYKTNIGDTIAIQAIRNRMEKYYGEPIEWKDIDLIKTFARHKNDVSKSKSTLSKITKEVDLLIVGGCGLIEGANWNKTKTGWKLPFNSKTLKGVHCPMVSFAIGANFFRGMDTLTPAGKAGLNDFIDRCDLFSVRNDGSYETLRKMGFKQEKLEEVPDGGIIYDQDRIKEDLDEIKLVAFNPTYNNSAQINKRRGITPGVRKKIGEFFKSTKGVYLPHTPKAYKGWKGEWLASQTRLKSGLKAPNVDAYIDEFYNKVDALVPMHGHGQLVAFGKNVPFITLATQDKNSDFCKKYSLTDYMIDSKNSKWVDNLFKLVEKLQSDEQYLKNWYEIRHLHYGNIVETFDDYTKRVIELAK
jgi:polysaccharide pyruvyl transferase WcaK-like protein